MRISDWSSDVCSSDLQLRFRPQLNSRNIQVPRSNKIAKVKCRRLESQLSRESMAYPKTKPRESSLRRGNGIVYRQGFIYIIWISPYWTTRKIRSEERRVGKDGDSTCRSRGLS